MREVLDLHIHSHFSMATSKNMDLEHMSEWARKKGITILATGDITHPLWVNTLKNKLTDLQNGLFEFNGTKFILCGEVNIVFKKNEKLRKIHLLVAVPSFKLLTALDRVLSHFGNLSVDGRPTLFISGEQFVKVVSSISDEIFIIPAHIWTPWFGLFGSKSGFDRIEDCFGKETEKIFALETGLSSDPYMNYLVRDIDRFTMVSNSDAHSPENIAREANVMKDIFSYKDIFDIIKNKDKRFLFTIEFFPEEGKYFGDGHRKCNVHFVPKDKKKVLCPICGKPLTYGVFHRVMALANWKKEERKNDKIPFKHVIPLKEIIAQVVEKGKNTKTVDNIYQHVVSIFGSELNVLIFEKEETLFSKLDTEIAEAIVSMRKENVEKQIGYDGVYGKILIKKKNKEGQLGIFDRSFW